MYTYMALTQPKKGKNTFQSNDEELLMIMNSTTEQMQRMKSCNSEFHAVTVNPVHLSPDMDFAQHIFYIPPKIVEAIYSFYQAFIFIGSINIYTTVVQFHSQTKKLSVFTHVTSIYANLLEQKNVFK